MENLIKIKPVYLRKLNNAQYLQFMIEVEKLIGIATPEKLYVSEELLTRFREKIQVLTEIAFESRSEMQTKQIKELDKERGNALRYLITSIRNESKSHIARKKEAAEILTQAMKNYRSVPTMAYREESVAVRALLDDLAKEHNAKHIATLGLSETVEHIKTINRQFETLLGDRVLSKSEKKLGNTRTIRKEMDVLYDAIALLAQSQNIINSSAESQKFISVLNKLIDDTFLVLKAKK